MDEKGIRLCQHAETFENFAGTFAKIVHARNTQELHFAVQHYRAAIVAVAQQLIQQIHKMPKAESGSEEQHRRNYTVAFIRRRLTFYVKASHKKLSANVWRG